MTRPLTEILAEMRYESRRIEGDFIEDWADEIEAAMREPVAITITESSPLIAAIEYKEIKYLPGVKARPDGTKLFAAPPAAELSIPMRVIEERIMELRRESNAPFVGYDEARDLYSRIVELLLLVEKMKSRR